jgi:DASS family divalent anion:Na+ symporter
MTNEVIWLIVVSFFFAKGFEKTGLGERIANMFVQALGKSTLGLSYGLNVAEMLLAPAMPSTSARAGGIFMPIIKSLSEASGSKPGEASRNKMGSFLTQAQFQTSIHSSNLFLTAAAQNLLCLDMAAAVGAPVPNAFATWTLGAALPSLVGIVLTPLSECTSHSVLHPLYMVTFSWV